LILLLPPPPDGDASQPSGPADSTIISILSSSLSPEAITHGDYIRTEWVSEKTSLKTKKWSSKTTE
jgi:hypothetical protein